MKNHNVYEFTGDIEKSIKDGDIRNIILFENSISPVNKILNSFADKKSVEANDKFPFDYNLIKTRSPWRIGTIQIKEIKLKDIIIKNEFFDSEKFLNDIKIIIKSFKNTINGIVIPSHCIFKKDIVQILNDNVRDTKVVIIN